MKRLFIFTIMIFVLTSCTAFNVQLPETTGTDMPPANKPNPASVYCEENGNKLEIRTAADSSQSGVCVFPDGSICEEWSYFRGECRPSAQISSTPTAIVEPTLEASKSPEVNGAGGYMPPGTSEKISNWWGVIKATEPGAKYDDYFERQDLGQIIYFGIDSLDPQIKAQIKILRDSGKIVHLYGTLFSNVPDYNGSQVQVDQIEIGE